MYPCNRHHHRGLCEVTSMHLLNGSQSRYRAAHSVTAAPPQFSRLSARFLEPTESHWGRESPTFLFTPPRIHHGTPVACLKNRLPASSVRRTEGGEEEKQERPPAVASTAPTRRVPAVASIARAAGTQYVSQMSVLQCLLPGALRIDKQDANVTLFLSRSPLYVWLGKSYDYLSVPVCKTNSTVGAEHESTAISMSQIFLFVSCRVPQQTTKPPNPRTRD